MKTKKANSRSISLVVAVVLLVCGIVGGTLAWLTDKTAPVTNVFTTSDINITLVESDNLDLQMIPGHTIAKDPVVTVEEGSEDCWMFVKITESTTPDLDAYISYAIAAGWEIVEPTDTNGTLATISTSSDEIVIGRKVYKDDATKTFNILGAGEYTDPMDVDDTTDDFKITWGDNQVCVKPSVTEQMMEDISTSKPTLSFQAYAVQLFKTNSNGDKANTDDEFTAAEAWARAADMTTTP